MTTDKGFKIVFSLFGVTAVVVGISISSLFTEEKKHLPDPDNP